MPQNTQRLEAPPLDGVDFVMAERLANELRATFTRWMQSYKHLESGDLAPPALEGLSDFFTAAFASLVKAGFPKKSPAEQEALMVDYIEKVLKPEYIRGVCQS